MRTKFEQALNFSKRKKLK